MEQEAINWTAVFAAGSTALWFISEALANIPAVKANSVFQLVKSVLDKMAKKPSA